MSNVDNQSAQPPASLRSRYLNDGIQVKCDLKPHAVCASLTDRISASRRLSYERVNDQDKQQSFRESAITLVDPSPSNLSNFAWRVTSFVAPEVAQRGDGRYLLAHQPDTDARTNNCGFKWSRFHCHDDGATVENTLGDTIGGKLPSGTGIEPLTSYAITKDQGDYTLAAKLKDGEACFLLPFKILETEDSLKHWGPTGAKWVTSEEI